MAQKFRTRYFYYLNTMCQNHTLEGLPREIESDYYKCATCIENKMHNIPFDNNIEKERRIYYKQYIQI